MQRLLNNKNIEKNKKVLLNQKDNNIIISLTNRFNRYAKKTNTYLKRNL